MHLKCKHPWHQTQEEVWKRSEIHLKYSKHERINQKFTKIEVACKNRPCIVSTMFIYVKSGKISSVTWKKFCKNHLLPSRSFRLRLSLLFVIWLVVFGLVLLGLVVLGFFGLEGIHPLDHRIRARGNSLRVLSDELARIPSQAYYAFRHDGRIREISRKL